MVKINFALHLALGLAVIFFNICAVDAVDVTSSTTVAEQVTSSTDSTVMKTSSMTVTWSKTIITATTISDATETTTSQIGWFTGTDPFSFVPPSGWTSALTRLSTASITSSTDTGDDENDSTTSVSDTSETPTSIAADTSSSTTILASNATVFGGVNLTSPLPTVTAALSDTDTGTVTEGLPSTSISTHVIVVTASAGTSATQNNTTTSPASRFPTGDTFLTKQSKIMMLGTWLAVYVMAQILA